MHISSKKFRQMRQVLPEIKHASYVTENLSHVISFRKLSAKKAQCLSHEDGAYQRFALKMEAICSSETMSTIF
jgi:hypothetical protein